MSVRYRLLTALVTLLSAGMPAHAQQAPVQPRAVVELFTSQGCSSCPAADALFVELAKDPSLIALTFPVTYWDYLGWKDTLGQPAFTKRQKLYAKARGDGQIYTPQAVVNGAAHTAGITTASSHTRRNLVRRIMPNTSSMPGWRARPLSPSWVGVADAAQWPPVPAKRPPR